MITKHSRGRPKPHSCGFTLLELLLVLALIVLILAIGFPAMRGLYVKSQLKAGAQQVQSELYQVRLDAMKYGKPMIFRYSYGTSVYEVMPKEIYDKQQAEKEQEVALAVSSEPQHVPATADNARLYQKTLYRKTLPEQLVFASSSKEPLLFFPNGRTSEAEIVLQTPGRTPYQITLHLRGLTGTASVSEVTTLPR